MYYFEHFRLLALIYGSCCGVILADGLANGLANVEWKALWWKVKYAIQKRKAAALSVRKEAKDSKTLGEEIRDKGAQDEEKKE